MLDAIFNYSENGEITQLEPVLQMAFNFIREDIDQNKKRWEDMAEARSEAGRRGGMASAKKRWGEESVSKSKQRLAKVSKITVNDNVSVNVNGSVIGEYEGKTEKPIKKEKIKPKTCKEDITSSEFHQYLNSTPPYMNYSISAEYLLLLAEKIDNWAKSKGKQIKDWKATARNWLLKDIEGDKLSKRGRSQFEEIFNSMTGF